jgi:hypothetical protein
MVKYFGLTLDDRELGFYAGFFMTAYMVGNGLTALFWGHMSDRHGKKAIIILGLLANTVPQVGFGMANSFALALALRFLMGLCNGLVGAVKAMAPELVPPNEQASAMSMVAATWGLGNLLGPAIGGLLSSYDLCEGAEAEARCPRYPFLLPSVVCAVASALGLAAVAKLLPDLRPAPAGPPPLLTTDPATDPSDPSGVTRAPEGDHVSLRANGADANAAASDAPVACDAMTSGVAMSPRALTRRSTALIGFYGMVALNDIVNNEIFPLWCVAPVASGGLELDSGTLGWLLSVSGLALLVFQLAVFPPISRRVSLTRLCLLSTALSGPLYALLPFVTLMGGRRTVFTALLVQTSLLRFSLGSAFTCTFTILNNSVHAEARGRMQAGVGRV